MCEGTSLAATQLATSLHANRPGRTRTCSPRFWSPFPATPVLHRLLIFNDLALGQQRRRRWTTPALALTLALGDTNFGYALTDPLPPPSTRASGDRRTDSAASARPATRRERTTYEEDP